jgi:flagellar biosynthetic protein FliR
MLDTFLSHWSLWLLVLCRTAAFVGAAPVLSARTWPMPVKAAFAALLAFSVTPSVHADIRSPWADPGLFMLAALKETVTGFALGFLATLVFSAISIAGGLADLQAGFGMGGWFEPGFTATGVTPGLLQTLFTLYFLGVGGLDGWMLTLLHSYDWVPLGGLGWPSAAADGLARVLGVVTGLGVEMCAPVVVAMLLTDLTLAFISRAAPQVNVFVAGLPMKLLVMWTVFALAMPGVTYVFGRVFQATFESMDAWLHALGG